MVVVALVVVVEEALMVGLHSTGLVSPLVDQTTLIGAVAAAVKRRRTTGTEEVTAIEAESATEETGIEEETAIEAIEAETVIEETAIEQETATNVA